MSMSISCPYGVLADRGSSFPEPYFYYERPDRVALGFDRYVLPTRPRTLDWIL